MKSNMSFFQGLECLSFSDQVLFTQFGKGREVPTPFKTIHEAFQSKADQQPDAIAVEQESRTLTYHELENASNGLANHLISMGLQPQQRVCLVVQRSLSMVIAMLAILKCGCQYVPLDGQVTAESALSHIMKDTDARFVLCLERFEDKVRRLAPQGVSIVRLDTAVEEPTSIQRPIVDVKSTDGAYAIYTSGRFFHLGINFC
jgi:non-ribosomal peptide synthetase component F